jgi:hypothetical protein
MARKSHAVVWVKQAHGTGFQPWKTIDLGFGDKEAQLARDIVESLKIRGYEVSGTITHEQEENL